MTSLKGELMKFLEHSNTFFIGAYSPMDHGVDMFTFPLQVTSANDWQHRVNPVVNCPNCHKPIHPDLSAIFLIAHGQMDCIKGTESCAI